MVIPIMERDKKIRELQSRQQHTKFFSKSQLKNKCEICEGIESLCRHHIKYDPPEIITVCYECHCLIHGRELGKSIYGSKYKDIRERWRLIKRRQRSKIKGIILSDSDIKHKKNPEKIIINKDTVTPEKKKITWRLQKRRQRYRKKHPGESLPDYLFLAIAK